MKEKAYTKKHLIIWIVATVVLMIVSFYAGSKHSQNALKKGFAGRAAGTSMAGGAGGAAAARGRFGAGGGTVMGSVISKDANSMTVKMRDGSSKIVLYSGSTEVSKSAAGSADDVSVGTDVSVIGTQNTDGSVTATTIQIRPAGAMPAGGTNGAPAAGQANPVQ